MEQKKPQKNPKKPRAIDMIFYWVRGRIRQNHFHIFWEKGKKTGGLSHKTPPKMAPQNYATKIFETNKKRNRKFKITANWNWKPCEVLGRGSAEASHLNI